VIDSLARLRERAGVRGEQRKLRAGRGSLHNRGDTVLKTSYGHGCRS
jgi:hypothetical protein